MAEYVSSICLKYSVVYFSFINFLILLEGPTMLRTRVPFNVKGGLDRYRR